MQQQGTTSSVTGAAPEALDAVHGLPWLAGALAQQARQVLALLLGHLHAGVQQGQ